MEDHESMTVRYPLESCSFRYLEQRNNLETISQTFLKTFITSFKTNMSISDFLKENLWNSCSGS